MTERVASPRPAGHPTSAAKATSAALPATVPAPGGPRILAVATRFPWPSETFVDRKVRALRDLGFDITVAAPWLYPQAPDLPAVPVLQLPRLRSPKTWETSARSVLRDRSARALAPAVLRDRDRHLAMLPLTAGRFDLIHFEFSGLATALVDHLPLLAPAKLAVSCRGHAEQIAPHHDPARRERLRQVFEQMSLIHCVSEDMAATVRGYGAPEEHIVVNRPAVDTARWADVGRVDPERRGTSEAPLRVLSVGRLHWKKGFDDAIRAIAAAAAAGTSIRYRIAGTGPEQEKLEYLIASLGLDDEVELLGWQSQDDVEAQLRWADAFLLPSLSEGISNSALEALAAGLPVVSTTCGGMEEVLTTPDAGILVDVGGIEAMATALGALVDPEHRRSLARGGAARAREAFDLHRQATVFADAYRTILGT